MRDRKFGISFLNEFQDRLYFGHDFCSIRNTQGMIQGMTLSKYLDNLLEDGAISRKVYDKVCSENARKLLRL